MGFTAIDDGKSPAGWTHRSNLAILVPGLLVATGALLGMLIAGTFEAVNGTACQTAKCGGRVSPALEVLAAVLLLSACTAFICSLFIYVRVSGGVLSARRLWRRKFEFPVGSVERVEPGYYGLAITNEDCRVYQSLTPQQPNVNAWRKVRDVSGEVADRIFAARDAARNGMSSS